ncbi:MAG: 4-hydroxythreonine-4-phosphate dehydrogenase PdxA [Candidatus Saelkia tenebricola]|nr:4-hydroxythreonine-4-phosphate dehydrogenase PdxA [Candidatus Saelkia tenebricola]
MSRSKSKQVILYTLGDPAGISPEIIVKVLSKRKVLRSAVHVIVADEEILKRTRSSLKSILKFNSVNKFNIEDFKENSLNIIDLKNAGNAKIGVPSKYTGKASLEYLKEAVGILEKYSKDIRALITLPVSKQHIELTGIKFKGHTEYLKNRFKVSSVLMIFLTNKFDVLLYTRHIPLNNVAKSIKKPELTSSILKAVDFYRATYRHQPKISILGLNPHAGEGGAIGKEEQTIIIPLIKKLKKNGIDINGPFPADGFFRNLKNINDDLIVSMYHDQVLPLIKSVFPDTVNFSLGLPFLRFSPNYGTAFNIAGVGIAETDSLEKAIEYALKLKCR